MFQPFRSGDNRATLPLGAAVEFVDAFGTEPLNPFFLEPGRHRCGHMKNSPEAREIAANALGFRQRPYSVHHRRHIVHPVDAVLLDEPQGFRCVEVRHPDEFTAAEEPGVAHGERCIVIERSGI